MTLKQFLPGLMLFMLVQLGFAQQPGQDSLTRSQPVLPDSTVLPVASDSSRRPKPTAPAPKLTRDSNEIWFNYAYQPERMYQLTDTLPGRTFRFYDPARQQLIDYGTLGNLGSSARPLLYEARAQRGFDTGVHAFDLYRLDAKDLAFFRNRRTFSDVFFSQGRTQNENMLRARLSRTFDGGATIALDYKNFNNLGQFNYQTAKNNSLSVGLFLPVSERYQLYLIHTRNVHRQQENGGIVTDTVFGDNQFAGPIAAAIRLPDEDAQIRLSDQAIQAVQHLDFARAGNRQFRLSHESTAKWENFKFFDDALGADSLYFDTFFVDRRGLRNHLKTFRWDNRVELITYRIKRADQPSDVQSLGLSHSWIKLDDELRDTSLSNLFLDGRLEITPSDKFSLQGTGGIGLLSNFGEYQVRASMRWEIGKAGIFDLGLLAQRRPPSYLQHRLVVSQRLLWENDFEKPVETSLSASYSLPALGLRLGGKTHLVNNYIYFDQQGIVQQTTSPLQVAQLYGQLDLKLGRVHFDNTLALQNANRSDVFRLPTWFSKNSLYYAGHLFQKKLDLQVGVDFRINSEFRPDGYQPLHWQFVLQDSLTQAIYPWADAFIAFKIERFRFFFRYENLFNAIDNTQVYYQTAYYPQAFGTFRFGIAWRFLDSNLAGPNSGSTSPTNSNGPLTGFGRTF
jgi:hypothetical protein